MKIFGGMKIWKWMGVLTVLALTGWGCSNMGSTTIKISSWGDPKENAILQDLVENFNKTHPKIKVELQRVSWGEYNTKLLTQVAGGIAPDVIFVSTDNIADLYPRNILEPLDDYIKADNFSTTDFYPSVLSRFTVNGHLYVLPRDTSPICVVYYDKKAFDEAKLPYPTDDWSWSDLLTDARALTKRDETGHTTQWGYTEDWPMLELWTNSAGVRWANDSQNPTAYAFNNQVFVDALQYRTDLILKEKVMPGPSNMTAMGGMGTSDLFQNGTSAMFVSGIWKTPQFRDIKNFDWDVVMFPKGPTGLRGFPGGGSGYGILNTSKNKKAAWEFIKYIAGPEGEAKMASTGLSQPALKSVAESGAFVDNQKPLNKKFLLKAVDFSVYPPMTKDWSEIYQGSITPVFDQLWIGKITAQEAINQLVETLKNKPLISETVASPAANPAVK
jgi:ABC-type glycerol-3-phosphate transport system substrate-binding protein